MQGMKLISNRTKRKSLESLLLESGKVTKENLRRAFEKQGSTGKRLEDILVEDKVITENEILKVMESYLGIKYVELSSTDVNPEAVRIVPGTLARKYNLMPVDLRGGRIVVAMSNPLDLFASDDIKFSTSYEVEPVISSREEIRRAIEKYYTRQDAEQAVEDLKNQVDNLQSKETMLGSDYIDEVNNAPAVRLVNSIISQAVKCMASDIHIEPYENYVKIRFRIDGQLQEVMRIAKQTVSAVVTRIKIMSNLNIAEKRLPQDGRVMITIDNKDIDIRVSILPTVFGEKIVMRILNRSNFLAEKESLGFTSEDLKKVDSMIRFPYGIILITGPTGSGKSTTLYTLLNELNTNDKNIVTIEDPVEYVMEGINQVHVNPKAGITFASGLRSILRQDPDVIMIGEIRDSETAEIAIRAAITGHLVFSTLHTNDAHSAVTRLVDMGIQPYLISSALIGSIAQRLVRKICPNCKFEYDAVDDEKIALGLNNEQNVKLYRGNGCEICNGTGYMGRTGVFEVMEFTGKHKSALSKNAGVEELTNTSMMMGMKTLRQNCISLVLSGVTTVDEMLKNTFIKL